MRFVSVPPTLDATSVLTLAENFGCASAAGEPIVLRGSEGFCRGLDLTRATAGVSVGESLDVFVRLLHGLRTASVPTVAAVDGPCLAGGLGIAAACDVVVAGPRARFGLPEALFGMVPAIVRPLLLERMSPHAVRLLALRGGTLTAAAAARLGLVDRVADDVGAVVVDEVRRLRRAARPSVAGLKQAPLLLAALEAGAAQTLERLRDPTVAAAVARFEAGDLPWEAA